MSTNREPRWLTMFRLFISLAPMVLEIVTPILAREDLDALKKEKKELEAKKQRELDNLNW